MTQSKVVIAQLIISQLFDACKLQHPHTLTVVPIEIGFFIPYNSFVILFAIPDLRKK
jgi:hypothetical protein